MKRAGIQDRYRVGLIVVAFQLAVIISFPICRESRCRNSSDSEAHLLLHTRTIKPHYMRKSEPVSTEIKVLNMFRNPKLYYDTNEITKVGCNKLLDRTLPKMSFQEDETVLDIGCGPGDNTWNIIRARIPKLKKLVAIDIRPEMIEFAKVHFSDEKIEHHVADIEDRFSLKPWEGSVSKAFSVNCFYLLKDQRNAFQNLYDLLKPNGDAALLFQLSTSVWDCFPEVINCEKWNGYLKDADQCLPDSHHLHLGADHYRKLLEDLGFEVLLCKEEEGTFLFRDDDDVLKSMMESFSPLPYYIPEEKRGEFMDEFFNCFVKSHNRNSDGQRVINHRSLTVHIRKY